MLFFAQRHNLNCHCMTGVNLKILKIKIVISGFKMLISEEQCRICLGKHRLSPIFVENVPEKIQYCASIELSQDDEFPRMICKQCLFYLDVAYIFRTVCEATDIRLRKYFAERKCAENNIINNTETAVKQENIQVLYSNSPVTNEIVIGEEEKEPEITLPETVDSSKENKIGRHTAKKISARVPKRFPPVTEANQSVTCETNKKIKSRIHQCNQCTKSFTYLSHLKRHMSVHSTTKKYSCHSCPKTFINRYNLKVHVLKHTGSFLHHCVLCKRGFSSPSLLKRHLNSHSRDAEFQCQYCPKRMLHLSSLKLHEKMHLYRPSYTCDVCFKTFAYTSSLAHHRKNHEETRGTSLKRHLTSHNTKSNYNFKTRLEPSLAPKVSNFKCDECDRKFVSKSLLIKHLKNHIGTND